MKKIISLLLISHFAFSQTARLDTNIILIGQQINFTVTNKIQFTDIWPNYNKSLVEGVEIIQSSEIDTINGIISQQFTITAWDSGSYYIPPISFSEESQTTGAILNVQTVILEENAQLKDIKKPIEEPIGWSDIWPWIISIIIICLIIYLVKKYVFNKKENKITIQPKAMIPADIVALEELSKLEKNKLWENGNIKEYQSQLSEIIRKYTENRFKFIALELTTNEILEEIESNLNKAQLNNLKILLQRADLAKFAKGKPHKTENLESMSLAKEFVNNTKEIRL